MRLPLRKVFICYRQADTQVYADRIYDSLSRALCLDVFKDLQRIDIGDSVQKVISAALRDSYALLVIIGPRWLEADATTGKPRVFDASDWVRLEIEQGLRNDCRVIPVLVDGARLPKPDELPDSIRALADRLAHPIRNAPDYEQDIDRLTRRLRQGLVARLVGNALLVLAAGALVVASSPTGEQTAMTAAAYPKPASGPRGPLDMTLSGIKLPSGFDATELKVKQPDATEELCTALTGSPWCIWQPRPRLQATAAAVEKTTEKDFRKTCPVSIEQIDPGEQEQRRYAAVLVKTVALRTSMRGAHPGHSPDMPQCAAKGELGILLLRYDGAQGYWRLAALELALRLEDTDFEHALYQRWRITVSLHMRLVSLMGSSADGLAHGSCALHVSEAEVAPTPQCWSMRRIIVKRKLRL